MQAAERTPAVVVVGSINMDLVAQAPALPQPGQTLIGRTFASEHGGKGANQAVAAARMGAHVAMIGRVGADANGTQLKQALADEGIDIAGLQVDGALPTGVALIVVADGGENSIVVVPGANHGALLRQVQQCAACIQAARVLVLQQEVPEDAVELALSLARAGGVTTVLNAAPVRPLSAAQFALIDWLVVNETEAAVLAGEPVDQPEQAEAAARALLARGPKHVVVTLGGKGVVHVSAQGASQLPAHPVQAVDTTGAGDTFVGALAAALAKGLPPAVCLQWGQAAAAVAVTRHGAQAAMPRADELGELPTR